MSKKILNDPDISYQTMGDKVTHELIEMTRAGVSYDTFENEIRRGIFTTEEWADFLQLSLRSMQRYKKDSCTFSAASSERMLRIHLLVNLGIDVFGTKEKFKEWLHTEHLALGGIAPRKLLDNTFGIGLIKDELIRIEHGVLT